jgi:hypothetical protein
MQRPIERQVVDDMAQGIMLSVRRFALVLLLGVSPLAGCSAAPPAVTEEQDACFRNRTFTEEIPRYRWGDPVHDPCWRYRPFFSDMK